MASSYIVGGKRPRRGKRRPSASPAPRLPPSSRATPGPDQHAAIEKAKLEWENTADALASLVCLLGDDGEVLRANRVIEDWSLGTVAGVLGAKPHALIHPHCRRRSCALAIFIRDALAQVRAGGWRQFEHNETVGSRFLHLTIRPMRRRQKARSGPDDPRAVLVATDQSALHRAEAELRVLNTDLERRVLARTQDLADANRDLRNEIVRREQAEVALLSSRNELLALSQQLIGAQEGERKRIAVELHDSVGQSLSAVKYTLERGVTMLRQRRGDAAEVFELAVRRIQEAAESIRAISRNLRPRILDELGVASALQWFCRGFAETYPGIEFAVDMTVSDAEVPERLATVIYRSAQEMLNNVAKHSRASKVRVRLALEGRLLALQVQDNGVGAEGAPAESHRHGSGLRNLRERAQMTGGDFTLTRAPRRGTLAEMRWTLAAGERPRND